MWSRPSPRLLLGIAGTLIASIVVGASLGSYATQVSAGRWNSVAPYDGPATDNAAAYDASPATPDTASTEPVVCKGCGPTLAQRRIAQDDVPGYGGADDPLVRRYLAESKAEEARWNQRDADRQADQSKLAIPAAPLPTPAPAVIRTLADAHGTGTGTATAP